VWGLGGGLVYFFDKLGFFCYLVCDGYGWGVVFLCVGCWFIVGFVMCFFCVGGLFGCFFVLWFFGFFGVCVCLVVGVVVWLCVCVVVC
jgi:hypothetical protein